MQYLLLFHVKNAPQCYVIRTLPVSFIFTHAISEQVSWRGNAFRRWRVRISIRTRTEVLHSVITRADAQMF